MKNSDRIYLELLEERRKEIESNLEKIRNIKNDDSISRTSQINGYEIELKEIEEAINNYTERKALSEITEESLERIDRKYQKLSNKKESYLREIEELRELKEKLLSIKAKRRVERKVEKLERLIKSSESKQITCSNRQRKKMLPKYKKEFLKNSLLARQKGRIKTYEDMLSDNEELKNMLNRDKLLDNIKERIYDFKGHHYMKKIGREKEILEEMQSTNSIIRMSGARVRILNRKYIEKIRDREETRDFAAAM